MRHITFFIGFLLISSYINVINGNPIVKMEDSGEWELRKDKGGIKVYTKEHKEDDILEYKATVVINTDIEKLIHIIHDVENYPSWTTNCQSAEIVEVLNDTTRIEYLTTAVPWPLTDRDVVLQFQVVKQTDVYFEATLKSKPEAVPENDKNTRIVISQGNWIFKTINDSQVEIEHQFLSDPGGGIPMWIVNMFIVSGPYKTLHNLKELCEKED